MTDPTPAQMPTAMDTDSPHPDAGEGAPQQEAAEPSTTAAGKSSEATPMERDEDEKDDDAPRHRQLERPPAESAGGDKRAAGAQLRDSRIPKTRAAVDREKVCPFLVRVFVRTDEEFVPAEIERRGLSDKAELVHTWKDASLREIASLLTPKFPLAKERHVAIHFWTVIRTQTRDSSFRVQSLGTVHNFRSAKDDQKTLDQARFVIGDGLLVSIVKCDPAEFFRSHGPSAAAANALPPSFDRERDAKVRDAFVHPDRMGHHVARPRFEPYGRPLHNRGPIGGGIGRRLSPRRDDKDRRGSYVPPPPLRGGGGRDRRW